ncbi:MAG: hypothetical protein EBV10_12325 [Synechococcaceae bacterium WB6_1A_059]|nr:hypothetical protein [Synechococcaceae bacterium WB6_1A_059]
MKSKLLNYQRDLPIFEKCIEKAVNQITTINNEFVYDKQDTIDWLISFKKDFINGKLLMSSIIIDDEPIAFYCAKKISIPIWFASYWSFFDRITDIKLHDKIDILDKPILEKMESELFYSWYMIVPLDPFHKKLGSIRYMQRHDEIYNKKRRYTTFIEHVIDTESKFVLSLIHI